MIALTALLLAAAPHRAPRPIPRIVSINPCVDAVLMRVADRGQIAGISHYSRDPQASSITPAQAAAFPITSGTAEEVVALRPDLVIAGGHVAPATIRALERLHVRLLQLPVPDSIAQSVAQVRSIGAAVGRPERGERLARAMERAVAAAALPPGRAATPALIWQGGGLVPGAGTLSDELLRRTGFTNLSAGYGLKQWDVLPLEYLVARPPRVLFAVGGGADDRMLGHPVLRRLARHTRIVPFAPRLMHCAGPTIIDAVARLSAVRRGVAS